MAVQYIVMAGVDLAESSNSDRCFYENHICNDKAEADAVAATRNRTEELAGHDNVLWFVSSSSDEIGELIFNMEFDA